MPTPFHRKLTIPLAATAFTVAAATMAPAMAVARSDNGSTFYSAQLAEARDASQFAAGGIVWHCAETRCIAPESPARPLRACRQLQREVGQIVQFSVAGEPLDDALLERCNS